MNKKKLITLFLSLCAFTFLAAQPAQEVRAVWLTTNWQLDWPSRTGVSEKVRLNQQAELCRILDRIKQANMNVVFFQSRVRGEVLFESAIEPWSRFVSGKSGVAPEYDPLAFAVEECHKRGLQCHAWMVSMPLGGISQMKKQGAHSLLKRKPAMVTLHKGEYYLEPSDPGAAEYLASLAGEIVQKYDVDGVHLDYIRYPEEVKGYPDAKMYQKSGTTLSLEDWRRENINRIVFAIYDRVKEIKPWVKVSSAPLGRFRDLPGLKRYGWDAYTAVYQDAQYWMRQGKHDLIAPMMYYKEELFYPYLIDWVMNSNGRPVVSGLGAYRLDAREADWDLRELDNQVFWGRLFGAGGQAIYRTGNFIEDKKGLSRLLQEELYRKPACYPPMNWVADSIVEKPTGVCLEEEVGGWRISWVREPGFTYNIYATDKNGKYELLEPAVHDSTFFVAASEWVDLIPHFGISAANKYHYESEIAQIPSRCASGEVNLCCLLKKSYDKDIKVLSLGDFSKYDSFSIMNIAGEEVYRAAVTGAHYDVALPAGYYRIVMLNQESEIENKYIIVE